MMLNLMCKGTNIINYKFFLESSFTIRDNIKDKNKLI
jgi:hypothetical protein